jgi:hypothetical protein
MISSPKRSATSTLGNITPQKLDTNEQARVLPYFSGRRFFPITWITSKVYNPFANPVTQKVGKKTQTTGYVYGGSVAGTVCHGMVDFLEAIEIDGEIVWSNPGGITRDGAHVNATGPIVVPNVGTFNLVWGTQTQGEADFLVCNAAAPEEHPYYRGQAIFEAKGLIFGEGRNNPPNIRILIERAPRFGLTMDETRSREGASLVTSLAELIGNKVYGAGRPDLIDEASWAATGAAIKREQVQAVPGDAGHVAVMGHGSVYVEQTESLQSIAGKVLENFDGWIRRKQNTGTLELGYFPHDGVIPVGLPELTLHDCAGKPEFTAPGLADDAVITDAVVKFVDRDWQMDPRSVAGISTASRKRLGAIRRKTFDRPFIHTAYQGTAQANELVKIYSRPAIPTSGNFRREKVLNLLPGDRFIFSYGPSAYSAICRVTRRRDPGRGGVVRLEYIEERGLAPLGYVPDADPAPARPAAPAPVPIVHARIFELPLTFVGEPEIYAAALAERPSANTWGFELHYSNTDATYDQLDRALHWALRGSLVANIADNTGTFNIAASGLDLSVLTAQSDAAKADNTLLLFVDNEIMSIGAGGAAGGGIYTIDVLRGRAGSVAAPHAAAAEIYIIPRAHLVPVTHLAFPVAAGVGYFKLLTFTPTESQAMADALRIVFNFADTTALAPTNLSANTGTGQVVDLKWDQSTTPYVIEYIIYRATGPGFGDEDQVATIAATQTPRYVDIRVAIGTQYRYRIKARSSAGLSNFSATVTATPGTIGSTSMDLTPPGNPVAPEKNAAAGKNGTNLTNDGAVYSYMTFTMGALPVRAIGQYLVYRLNGAGSYLVGGVSYNPAGEDLRLDFLPPGASIEVAARAFTINGVPSIDVAGAHNPYLVPGKTAQPNPPTGGSLAADSTAPAVKGDYTAVLWGCRVTVTAPNDADVAAIEVKATFTNLDNAADFTWYDESASASVIRRTATRGQTLSFALYAISLTSGWVRVRIVDASENRSDWLLLGNATSNAGRAVKDMALQNSDSVAVTGIQTGSGGSVEKVIARCPIKSYVAIAAGTGGEESFNFSLTGKGFSTKPDGGALTCTNDSDVKVRYDVDDAGNSSTNAVFKLNKAGGLVASGPYRVTGELYENF